MKQDKAVLLEGLKAKVGEVQGKIEAEKGRIKGLATKTGSQIKALENDDRMVYLNLRAYTEERLIELAQLFGSPFFVKCDLVYKKTGKQRSLYFAKNSFIEEGIYSWVAPVSSVRFESPGKVTYKLPNGSVEEAMMVKKEQYMIVDGKIMFFATETVDSPRELIHQEHLASRKSGFMLPEIVALMEKAQDAVIRAHHKGSFVISGPAGSGKTTLALHRVAYLIQSPDSAHLYHDNSVIVFVQDNGTKDYFSHLLPELGINRVRITTFFEWADEILDLKGAKYVPTLDLAGEGAETFEYEKLKILRGTGSPKWSGNYVAYLDQAYKKLPPAHAALWLEQKKTGAIDRIDLTLLMKALHKTEGGVKVIRNYQSYKNGKYSPIKRTIPVEYRLMIIDEFQNYMPEQLAVLKSCLSEETQSAVFVGDMAQQVYRGTIRSWEQIGEVVPLDRNVRLHKVYRNTRQILEYIRGLGYAVEIPEGIKDGPKVAEKDVDVMGARVHVAELIKSNPGKMAGLIFADARDIEFYKKEYDGSESVRIATMIETQGVEFDITCLIGMPKSGGETQHMATLSNDQIKEEEKIRKDLMYVALTRAMSEMHVLRIL
ncbi:MAG TPA: UvrD-helicase domain-containing protein [Candidatus Paceibacterota bacterium]